jgi:probable HAF family extracellular repeat protein
VFLTAEEAHLRDHARQEIPNHESPTPRTPSATPHGPLLATDLLALGLASQPLAGYAQNALAAFAGLGGKQTYANAINNAGQIVELARTADNTTLRTKRLVGGAAQDINPTRSTSGQALELSSSGQVVGSADFGAGYLGNHAFSFSHGVMSDLGSLGGANSHASDLNARGSIVGTGTHNGHDEAFVLKLRATWQGANGSWDRTARWRLGGLGARLGRQDKAGPELRGLPHEQDPLEVRARNALMPGPR